MINRNNIDFNAYYEMNKKMAMGNEFFITLQMCILSLIEPKEFVIICVSYMLSFICLYLPNSLTMSYFSLNVTCVVQCCSNFNRNWSTLVTIFKLL